MLALAAAALLLIADPEVDVLKFKDRRPDARGFIVKETKDRIKFRIVLQGGKGQVSGGGTVTFLKSEIKEIIRGSKKARDKVKKKSDALLAAPVAYEEALRKYDSIPERMMGEDARRVMGRHFTVWSTCDDRFVREVTFYLDRLYTAYQGNFGVQRNRGRKVTVYVLTDFDEYTRFLQAKMGRTYRNPALYNPAGNYIVAYNLDPKEKADEVRREALRIERLVADYKKQAGKMESDIRREASKTRRKIDAEAAAAKRQIRAQGGADMAERLRQVDRWKTGEVNRLKGWENSKKKEIKDWRDKVNGVIAKNRKVLWNNYRVRLERNKAMFETLFHEAFHAFSHNFLWNPGRRPVPRWLEEGLASYFERSVVEAGELTHGGAFPAFLDLLRKKGGSLLPLEKVLRGDPTMFLIRHQNDEDRSNLYYAQSWAIAHFMVGRVPRERIIEYGNAIIRGADPVLSFQILMGKSLRAVETDIQTHLQGLK